MESSGSAVVDFGRFCTGFLVVMGVGTYYHVACAVDASLLPCQLRHSGGCGLICVLSTALPALLAHCGLITAPAMAMSIVGGLLIYGTIISFTMFFQEEQDF